MPDILALWSTPRSRSTAFIRMMRQRGDFTIRTEPFEASAYYSEARIFNRLFPDNPDWNPADYNYINVLNSILAQSRDCERLFIKDHPYHFIHVAKTPFLDLFRHTFLIRNPAQALPSYFRIWPDLTFRETGYQAQYQLFHRIVRHTGKVPPVIDADDLVNNTEATIRAYCSAVDIPFIAASLSWDPKEAETEKFPWKHKEWHENLIQSSGIQNTPDNSYPDINDYPELRSLYDNCMPFYEKMLAHKI